MNIGYPVTIPLQGKTVIQDQVRIVFDYCSKDNVFRFVEDDLIVVEKIIKSLESRQIIVGRWVKQTAANLAKQFTIEAKKIWELVRRELLFLVALEDFRDLASYLEVQRPNEVSVDLIKTHNNNLRNWIYRNFRSFDTGKVDWKYILNKLGLEERVNIDSKEAWTVETIVTRAELLLEKHQPKRFNMLFFKKKDEAFFRAIQRNLQVRGDKRPFRNFVSALSPKWQERFVCGKTKLSDIDWLRHLLDYHHPLSFSPQWINSRDTKLYDRLAYKVIKTKRFTWESIFAQLGNDEHGNPWISRWNRRRFYTDLVPKETYWDPTAVEVIQDLHQDKLYVFIEQLDDGDKVHFEVMCLKLITLAQEGNNSARDFLETYLQLTVEKLIYNHGSSYKQSVLSRLIDHKDLVTREIIRSIYRFDLSKGTKFFSYLYTTMFNLGLQVKTTNFSLNEEIVGQYEAGNLQVYGKAQGMYAGR